MGLYILFIQTIQNELLSHSDLEIATPNKDLCSWLIGALKGLWLWLISHLISIIGPLIGAFAGAFAANYLTNQRNWHKEKNDKHIKLHAALAALENSRIILLALKHDFIKPYQTQVDQFFLCMRLCTPENLVVNWDDGYFAMIVKDQSYPKLNNFLYNEVLDFIALQRSPYLIALSSLQGHLDLVNELLNKRYEFLKEKNTLAITKTNESAHNSLFCGLIELVDCCLAYIVLCKDYLNEYASTFMPGIKLSEILLQTNYEADMPAKDLLSSFDELIKKAILANK